MVKEGKPEYLVFGMGAIGSVLAGLLSEAGCSVTCQGRGRHFRQAMDCGLKITGIWGEHSLQPGSMEELKPGPGKKFQVILLCVKSMHTPDASSQAAGLLEDDGIMVSMQNGLGNWEAIGSIAGRTRTAGGRVIFGSEIPEPGVARVTVNADDVLVGPAFGSVNERLLDLLQRDLMRGGIPARVVSAEDIRAALWGKVMYNSALNPLSAVLGVTYGELGEKTETRQIMKGVLEEIFEVMNGKGVRVPFRDAEEYYRFLIERLLPPTVSHRSSMLQDISSGRPTEIDALNGAICRYARELGIKAPYNELLTRLIKFKEGQTR